MGAFSLSDRKILESCPYVTKLTEKHVVYSKKFIDLMLRGARNGESRVLYFNRTLGVNCFDKKYVDSCLNRWKKKPFISSTPERRGRKKDIFKMSEAELRAENAYMKEVIAQLKKLRGLTDSDL